jgi:aryl sulfotransferase
MHPDFVLEKGDIIIASPPKCGTHFGMQMVYQLISGGDMSFESIYDHVHWLELRNFKGQTDEQRCEKVKNMPKAKNGMRAFKSHFGFPILPLLPQVKYICILRDTREMAVSLYHFQNSHNAEFWKYWEYAGERKTLDQTLDDIVSIPFIYGTIKSNWEARNQPNVLLLSFTNMIKDLPKEIEKVRKFLDIPLTDAERDVVLKNTSFEEMKKHEIQFEATKIGPLVDGKYISPLLPGGLIRKGKNDQGNTTLSPEQVKKLDDADHQHLSAECIAFMRTGELKEETTAKV